MKIDSHLALPYQKSLIFAALENFSASDLLGNVYGGQFGVDMLAWKNAAIDFLHRNLVAELIALDSNPAAHDLEVNAEKVLDAFLSSDPNENPEIWMGIQFHGTDKLNALVVSHEMLGWECIQSPLNRDFIDAVSNIYKKSGL